MDTCEKPPADTLQKKVKTSQNKICCQKMTANLGWALAWKTPGCYDETPRKLDGWKWHRWPSHRAGSLQGRLWKRKRSCCWRRWQHQVGAVTQAVCVRSAAKKKTSPVAGPGHRVAILQRCGSADATWKRRSTAVVSPSHGNAAR